MANQRPFRFGVMAHPVTSLHAWRERARRIESHGALLLRQGSSLRYGLATTMPSSQPAPAGGGSRTPPPAGWEFKGGQKRCAISPRAVVPVTLGLLLAIGLIMISMRERVKPPSVVPSLSPQPSPLSASAPLAQPERRTLGAGLADDTLPIATREPLAPPESRPAPLALPTPMPSMPSEVLPTLQPMVLPDLRPAPVLLPTLQPTVQFGFTPAPSGERQNIPILMYHYVRWVDAAADPLGFNLSVTPEHLEAQLAWLRSAGYETVRMATVAACVRGEGPCPARAVALTFDDGYLDAYGQLYS